MATKAIKKWDIIFAPIRLGKIKRSNNTKCWRDVRKVILYYTSGGSVMSLGEQVKGS